MQEHNTYNTHVKSIWFLSQMIYMATSPNTATEKRCRIVGLEVLFTS